MRIYELVEVSSKPRKNDYHYSSYRVYNNSLYLEAECLADCNPDIEEDMTDEEFDKLVEKELKNIIEILERYGRYPINGIPRFVAY